MHPKASWRASRCSFSICAESARSESTARRIFSGVPSVMRASSCTLETSGMRGVGTAGSSAGRSAEIWRMASMMTIMSSSLRSWTWGDVLVGESRSAIAVHGECCVRCHDGDFCEMCQVGAHHVVTRGNIVKRCGERRTEVTEAAARQ